MNRRITYFYFILMGQYLFGFILYQCDPRTFTTIMTDSVYFLLTEDEAFRKYKELTSKLEKGQFIVIKRVQVYTILKILAIHEMLNRRIVNLILP